MFESEPSVFVVDDRCAVVAWMRVTIWKHHLAHHYEGVVASSIWIELDRFEHAVGVAAVRLLRRAAVESPHRAIVDRLGRFSSDLSLSA